MPVRIIVCGGRHFPDRRAVWRVLDHIHTYRSVAEIIQGECATGADRYAREWALDYGIPLQGFAARWDLYGRRAGPMRNREMLACRPDGVVAFPGGRGTGDMIAAAGEAGIAVYLPFGV